MRLIDADALLNLPFEKMIHTDYGDTCVPIEEIEAAPTVDINELKPLVDKVVEILPELTDAIIKELPKMVSEKIKCSECSYYTNTFNGKWVSKEYSDESCENCKHQAKLPTQDPCHRCLYCYTSQFEPKDGSESDMMTKDKLCGECEEKCDWYKESIKKGNVPIGCTQQIADDEETSD